MKYYQYLINSLKMCTILNIAYILITYVFVFQENKWLSIDNEDYEVKPMRLSLLPNAVYLFKPDNSMNQKKNDQESSLSLDKLKNHIGLKQFV